MSALPPIAILSAPRSANHFVRYIIEFLTGRATLGEGGELIRARKLKDNGAPVRARFEGDSPICWRDGVKFLDHVTVHKPIARKYHHAVPDDTSLASAEKLLFLVRNPLESAISHHCSHLDEDGWLPGEHLYNAGRLPPPFAKSIKRTAEEFLDNINFFNEFPGPKQVITYEQLIEPNPSIPVNQIFDICGGSEGYLQELLGNFEKYRAASLGTPFREPISVDYKERSQHLRDFGDPGPTYHQRTLSQYNRGNFERISDLYREVCSHPFITRHYV